MKKLAIILCAVILSCGAMRAASPQRMLFHCDQDTLKINELLKRGMETGITKAGPLAAAYARMLLDVPYVAHTLEHEGDEVLTINIDELDCTTFVESVYALVRTTLNGRYSWRDYASNLESIRYRDGVMTDYASRLHYSSNWVVDNTHRGNVVDITRDFKSCKYMEKTINFMSTHADKYMQLSDTLQLRKVKEVEVGYRRHRIPYIAKEQLYQKSIRAQLKDGDIICMLTKIDGLDVSHLGMVLKDGDKVMFINASLRGGKVQIEPNLAEYLRPNRNCPGVRVLRIKD